MLTIRFTTSIILLVCIYFLFPVNSHAVERLGSFIDAQNNFKNSEIELKRQIKTRNDLRKKYRKGIEQRSLSKSESGILRTDIKAAEKSYKRALKDRNKAAREKIDADKSVDVGLGAILSTQNSDTATQYKFVSTELISKLIGKTFDGKEHKYNPCDEEKKKDGEEVIASNVTPTFNAATGSADAFDSIYIGFAADIISVTCKQTAGTKKAIEIAPNWDKEKPMQALQASVGVETNQRFNNVNFLAEVGYVPLRNVLYINEFLHYVSFGWLFNGWKDKGFFKDGLGFEKFELGETVNMGVFVQGGYKQKIDTVEANDSNATGGGADESSERPDTELFRIKAHAELESKIVKGWLYEIIKSVQNAIPGKNEEAPVKVFLQATGWSDIKNGDFYHKVKTGASFNITKDLSNEWVYENGSGAPNFNQGEQFTTNLQIRF